MQYHCKYDELKDPEVLTPHPRNYNKHPDRQIELLSKIINHTGFRHSVIVSKGSGFVVAGHGRIDAAKKLGVQVPVQYQEFKNEAEEFEFLVADNKIAELAKPDDNVMIEGIKELKIEDFELLGLEDFALPVEVDPAKEEIEDDIPTAADTRAKPGDVWRLGEHKVMCGDATDIKAVEALMAGKKADLFFTDPPYGVDYEGVNNDHLKAEKLQQFLTDAFACASAVMRPGACYYIWHPDIHAYEFISAIRDNEWRQARPSVIQWVKDSLVLSQGDYHSRNEPCLYGWKDGAAHKRVEDRKQDTIWEFPKPRKADGHPTMKPVALCERAIRNSSESGWVVLDLFAGSGSSLIASEKVSRKCYCMELDPKYVDVILSRWERYTGKAAELET